VLSSETLLIQEHSIISSRSYESPLGNSARVMVCRCSFLKINKISCVCVREDTRHSVEKDVCATGQGHTHVDSRSCVCARVCVFVVGENLSRSLPFDKTTSLSLFSCHYFLCRHCVYIAREPYPNARAEAHL
jgi:hypothetical protein